MPKAQKYVFQLQIHFAWLHHKFTPCDWNWVFLSAIFIRQHTDGVYLQFKLPLFRPVMFCSTEKTLFYCKFTTFWFHFSTTSFRSTDRNCWGPGPLSNQLSFLFHFLKDVKVDLLGDMRKCTTTAFNIPPSVDLSLFPSNKYYLLPLWRTQYLLLWHWHFCFVINKNIFS